MNNDIAYPMEKEGERVQAEVGKRAQVPLLSMEGIDKRFPGVHALDNCRFELEAGEVHALVGENGAGKSTLMKVLSGIYAMDTGEIRIEGIPVEIHDANHAQQMGISIIHQEINLMRDLTVAENIYIGREPVKALGMIDKRAQNRMAKALLERMRIDLTPTTRVKDLTVAKQQMVEIAKAFSHADTRILIMDEPTAALTDSEIEDLFRLIRELKARGVGIIYISHRMDELKRISDRVTVMRDGQYVGTVDTASTEISDIISMMVGRVIYEQPKEKSNVPDDAPIVLECRHIASGDVADASFVVRRGEILGFAGLMGAGRTELARLVFGADPKLSGEIFVHGQKVDIRMPTDAVRAGIGYLSEDRKQFGLCMGLSLADNVAIPNLYEFSTKWKVDDRRIAKTTREYVDKINIRTPGVRTKAMSLSGGNQQKVVLAKWLVRNCDVLIFDEPTRGIDVGAKSEIYKLMSHLAEEGKAIIMISSEMPELLRMSDRICVMCEGHITGEMLIQDATQEKIMTLATKTRK